MSETRPKFTPGPWRTYTGHRKVIPIGSDAGSIATASGGRAATCYTGAMSREEALANAHLIAAAPEMYAKLAELRDEMQCVCRLNAVASQLGAGIPCTRCELDQLLAKAEGRAVPEHPAEGGAR